MGARPLPGDVVAVQEVSVVRCMYTLFGTDRGAYRKQTKADLDLTALVKRELIQVGDVLAYKRTFSHLKVTVEKDLLVRCIMVLLISLSSSLSIRSIRSTQALKPSTSFSFPASNHPCRHLS